MTRRPRALEIISQGEECAVGSGAKSVSENRAVPTGLIPRSQLCPALPCRAFKCRPFGDGERNWKTGY